MSVVNYLSSDWIALRWGEAGSEGLFPNSICTSANQEGDCLIWDEVMKGTLLDVYR